MHSLAAGGGTAASARAMGAKKRPKAKHSGVLGDILRLNRKRENRENDANYREPFAHSLAVGATRRLLPGQRTQKNAQKQSIRAFLGIFCV